MDDDEAGPITMDEDGFESLDDAAAAAADEDGCDEDAASTLTVVSLFDDMMMNIAKQKYCMYEYAILVSMNRRVSRRK